jgi:hypothetical protein
MVVFILFFNDGQSHGRPVNEDGPGELPHRLHQPRFQVQVQQDYRLRQGEDLRRRLRWNASGAGAQSAWRNGRRHQIRRRQTRAN